MVDISLGFNAREYKSVMYIAYSTENDHISYEIDLDGHSPYPHVRLDEIQLKSLIKVLNHALVASQMKEPDYEAQRGISIPVDMDRSNE